jgi:hypothetical protein
MKIELYFSNKIYCTIFFIGFPVPQFLREFSPERLKPDFRRGDTHIIADYYSFECDNKPSSARFMVLHSLLLQY